ncbi:Uncharacterised protein [Sphingobacterium daejeonense]|nr:Uncharacterised protein [Sphingobacterium daejeonense]
MFWREVLVLNTAFISFVADPISQVYRNDLKDIPEFLKDGFFWIE